MDWSILGSILGSTQLMESALNPREKKQQNKKNNKKTRNFPKVAAASLNKKAVVYPLDLTL